MIFQDLAGLLFWHALAGNQRFLPLSLYIGGLASTPPRQVLPRVWKVKRERQARTTPVWPPPLFLLPGFQELRKTRPCGCLSVTELTEEATSPSPLARSRPFPCLQFIKIEDNAQGFPSPNLPASESIFFSSTPVETDVPDPLLTSSEANCVGLSETLVPTLKTGIMIVPI